MTVGHAAARRQMKSLVVRGPLEHPRPVTVRIDGPHDSIAGLDELGPLYQELHAAHLNVSSYRPLVRDATTSWARRRALYAEALRDRGASYFVARGPAGDALGYAFVLPTIRPDDTFETRGVLELVSLVVAAERRGQGVGRQLVAAVEDHARSIGADTVKVAVMAGNDRAKGLYIGLGYQPGEVVLLKRVDESR